MFHDDIKTIHVVDHTCLFHATKIVLWYWSYCGVAFWIRHGDI